MKSKKIIIILITSVVLISIFFIISRNGIIVREKKIIKEMTQTTLEQELNNTITQLNKEHEDYLNYIQACKNKIATALTNEGVNTSSEALLEDMATNISKVLQARTKDATATAEDIAFGKTAWVDGNLITGNSDIVLPGISSITPIETYYKRGSSSGSNGISNTLTYSITKKCIYLIYCKVLCEYNSSEIIEITLNGEQLYYVKKSTSDRGQYYTTILELNPGDELSIYLKAGNSGHSDQQDPQNICIIWELEV